MKSYWIRCALNPLIGGLIRKPCGTSLVAQWLRIHLPTQRTWVRDLVREDPTCHGTTKPMSHNY